MQVTKLSPVKRHTACYPDKCEVDLNRLLLSHRPNRWKKSSAAMLLLGAFAASGLAGCEETPASSPTDNEAPIATRKINMAPVFDGIVHSDESPEGDYTLGSSGLSMKSMNSDIVQLGNFPGGFPQESLTEESALAIITSVLEENGLNSVGTSKTVDVSVDVSVDDDDNSATVAWSFDLSVSGASEPIYVEFMPNIDVETNSELVERNALLLPEFPRESADELREKLSEVYDDSTGVVFYSGSMLFDEATQLTKQVEEFVEWLKGEGLI